MSILADTTEKKALCEIAKALRFFKRLECLQVSAGDEVRIRHAENIIKSVIGASGFDTAFSKRRGTHLIKQKP